MKYRICWEFKDGTRKGNGDGLMTLPVAKEWVELMNKEYPYINHWYEQESGK